MKVTLTAVAVGALGTIAKELKRHLEELEIRGKIKTIQTTEWVKSARILRRVLEKTCCHLDFSEKPPVRAGVKISK